MIDIKLVDENYAEVVAKIIWESFKEQARILKISEKEYPNYVAFETAEGVKNTIKNGANLAVAFIDERAAGTIRYSIDKKQADKGYIGRLALLPQYRGHAYGIELMQYAEMQLKSLGVKTVEGSIVAEFEKLKRFYEKQGYVPREKKLFKTLPFEVLFMEKTL